VDEIDDKLQEALEKNRLHSAVCGYIAGMTPTATSARQHRRIFGIKTFGRDGPVRSLDLLESRHLDFPYIIKV